MTKWHMEGEEDSTNHS